MKEHDIFFNRVHLLGKLICLGAIVLMFGIPLATGLVFDAMPSMKNVFFVAWPFLLIFVPIGIAEFFSYTSIIGPGVYLAMITGNLSNLKIPCAINAKKTLDLEPSSKEAEVVSTIAVGIASMVTMLVLMIGFLLLVPLEPVLTTKPMKLASAQILPAVMGTLLLLVYTRRTSSTTVIKRRVISYIPMIIVSMVVTVILMSSSDKMAYTLNQGWIMVAGMLVTVIFSYYTYKKKLVWVEINGVPTNGAINSNQDDKNNVKD